MDEEALDAYSSAVIRIAETVLPSVGGLGAVRPGRGCGKRVVAGPGRARRGRGHPD